MDGKRGLTLLRRRGDLFGSGDVQPDRGNSLVMHLWDVGVVVDPAHALGLHPGPDPPGAAGQVQHPPRRRPLDLKPLQQPALLIGGDPPYPFIGRLATRGHEDQDTPAVLGVG